MLTNCANVKSLRGTLCGGWGGGVEGVWGEWWVQNLTPLILRGRAPHAPLCVALSLSQNLTVGLWEWGTTLVSGVGRKMFETACFSVVLHASREVN